MNDDAASTQPVSEGADAPDLNQPMGEEPQQAVNTPVDQAQEPSQSTNEGADAPEPESSDEPEEDEYTDTSRYYAGSQYDLPTNEDGSVDPIKFAQQIEARLEEKMRFQQQEQRTWNAIEKKYPQIRGDKETREFLLNQRIAGAVQGKETNLMKLADRLYKREQTAKNQGRVEATTSTKVQKAASLETNSSNTGDNNKTSERLNRISMGDKAAANDLLTEWLDAGII